MNEQMIRKNNMRIYPIYKMFAWDLLFYYAITFLFQTQVKGLSPSVILLGDSFYAIFRTVFQIFCIKIVDSLGKQKSLLLGNILVSISILILILGNGFFCLIILLNVIQSIGYNLKALCEPTILSDSIPKSSSSAKIYSKIDGKGSSFYYIFDAISSATTGFLYIINPYIPIIICFAFCLISTILSLAFSEPIPKSVSTEEEKSVGFISYYKDIFITFKQIIKSNRLKSLLIFSLCFWSILSVFSTLRSSILVDIGIPEQYFGIILACMQIIASLSARKQQWFQNKFKNRTLSWFSFGISLSFIFAGLFVVCNISYTVSIVTTLLAIIIIGIIKGPYHTLIQRYFNSFTNHDVNSKIFAIKSLIENLGRLLLSFFASFLLSVTTTAYTFIIIGFIFFVIFIFLLNYMKTRVGLKPEEYPEEDLIFVNKK